jgi:hypothetical protein
MGRPGLLGLAARTAVVAGTATAVSGGMQRRQQAAGQQAAEAEAYRDSQQAQQAQQAQAAQMAQMAQPPSAAAPATDVVSQLERLAALHAQGILTDDELAVQKQRILAG